MLSAIGAHRLISRQEPKVGCRAASPASLGVAGAHEEPVRPGVKARRVAQLREVSPDVQQRLLRRVLGKVDVAQDPVRHRMEPIAHGHGEARESPFVTVLRSNHEFGIHASSASCAGWARRIHTVWARLHLRRLTFPGRHGTDLHAVSTTAKKVTEGGAA